MIRFDFKKILWYACQNQHHFNHSNGGNDARDQPDPVKEVEKYDPGGAIEKRKD